MISPAPKIGFLVLAAGLSSRFNGNKLLTKLPNSDLTVLETTLQNIPNDAPIHVVYRPSMTTQKAMLSRIAACRPQFSFNGNEDLAEGMGISIAKGVKDTSNWDAWVICLSDMPWIETSTYRAIASKLVSNDIVAPFFKADSGLQKGNPVGFSKKFLQNLLNLSGDQGGRAIVQDNPEHVCRLTVKDAGILLDIDYPDDINQRQ
ncbi:MAG: nucleotidyltransferase family protein [Pseudomonadales bacterium]|nr:nucleotidyltransferase family protein [Pseudomonadales bacterium]